MPTKITYDDKHQKQSADCLKQLTEIVKKQRENIMSTPDIIYLEPPCCADPWEGQMWCEDDNPNASPERDDCEHCHGHWVPYYRRKPDEFVKLLYELKQALSDVYRMSPEEKAYLEKIEKAFAPLEEVEDAANAKG